MASVKLLARPERACFLFSILTPQKKPAISCRLLAARAGTSSYIDNTSPTLTLYNPLMLSSPKTLLRVW